MLQLKVDVDVNVDKIQGQLDKLANDADLGLFTHKLLAKMCDPYVPMDTGVLSQTVEISKDAVNYNQPYARYQYFGEVYGPNIPITEDGEIVGWFSPKGKKKYPTGRKINYSKEKHPLATSFWDEVMLRDKGEEFLEQVRAYIEKRAREIYG